jgi:hypothetical protein
LQATSLPRISRRQFLKNAETIARVAMGSAFVGALLSFLTVLPVHAYHLYVDLLGYFANNSDRYNVHSVGEHEIAFQADKVNVALRHDVDTVYGFEMANADVARKHDINSTFCLRVNSKDSPAADCPYSLRDDKAFRAFYQNVERNGIEIGYHYEVVDKILVNDGIEKVIGRIQPDTSIPVGIKQNLISIVSGSMVPTTDEVKEHLARVLVTEDVISLFKSELSVMRGYFEKITTVAPHGGRFNYLVEESERWDRLKKECGIISAYRIPLTRYISDIDKKVKNDFNGDLYQFVVTEMVKYTPPARLEISAHPEYWFISG